MQDIYTSEKITDRITKIYESFIVCCYLIEGDEKAMLLDCGVGLGDIKEYAETLTDLPIMLVASHAHVDHIGGVRNFKSIYVNVTDIPIVAWSTSNAVRMSYLKGHPMVKKLGYDLSTVPIKWSPFAIIPFRNGHVFDLGGIKIKAYEVPGHTRGSMFFKVLGQDIVFTGDTFGFYLHLCYHYPHTLTRWTQDYELLKKVADGCRLYASHGHRLVTWADIEWQYNKAKEIIAATKRNRTLLTKKNIEVRSPDNPHLCIYYRTDKVLPFGGLFGIKRKK